MWTVVLQGTGMRLSDLLLTTLLLDWPAFGEMKPRPRQAVDPRSEIVASEQQLQYLCLVVGISKMSACMWWFYRQTQHSVVELKLTSKNVPELAFQNEAVCARDGERMSVDVGFLDTHSKPVLLNFGFTSPWGMGKRASPPSSVIKYSFLWGNPSSISFFVYPVWAVE